MRCRLRRFALSRGQPIVTFSSSSDLGVGQTVIPVPGSRLSHVALGQVDELRPMRVRFLPDNMSIPRVSLKALLDDPSRASEFAGKVVFVGSTAATLPGDRFLTPSSPAIPLTGIEIHAEAFETMAQGLFITDVGDVWVFSSPCWWRRRSDCRSGICPDGRRTWRSVDPGGRAGHSVRLFHASARLLVCDCRCRWPGCEFRRQRLLSPGDAEELAVEQSARARYQQAMHFVTHEMRTPLSAIQGSSELISRTL